jgi:hypothetical protein
MADPTPKTSEQARQAPRPEGVPEKFWDPVTGQVRTEALLKSYSELEKTRGQPAADPAPAEEAPTSPPEQPQDSAKIEKPAEDAPAEKAAEPAPLAQKIESVVQKYAKGEVAEADFAELEAAGLPKQVVETYFQGLKALEEMSLRTAHEAAGGKETFDASRSWAVENLSDGDLKFYNDNVANPATAKAAVDWLVQKYRSAVPSEGRLVAATTPSANTGSVFRSQQELTTAMQDPRYKSDPAFRQDVAEKLGRSKQQGTLTTNVQHYTGRR